MINQASLSILQEKTELTEVSAKKLHLCFLCYFL